MSSWTPRKRESVALAEVYRHVASNMKLRTMFSKLANSTAADGRSQVRLLENDDLVFYANPCGSGDTVVVGRVLEDNAPNVWRLNVGTGELRQLTFGKDVEKGSCTPDGKWVVYNDGQAQGGPRVFKVSIDGGTTVELVHRTPFSPTVLPPRGILGFSYSGVHHFSLTTGC